MASTEGGVEIEKVAEETPEKIIKTTVDPLVGLQPCQAREVAFALGLEGKQINEFVKLMSGAYRAFVENDFALFEINPLAVRENGELAMCGRQNRYRQQRPLPPAENRRIA
jgi:succinyl-CoA synthetase beta subunit